MKEGRASLTGGNDGSQRALACRAGAFGSAIHNLPDRLPLPNMGRSNFPERFTSRVRAPAWRGFLFTGSVERAVSQILIVKRRQPASDALHDGSKSLHAQQHRRNTWKNLSGQPSEKFGDRA